jgi:hypothetical protein
MEKTFGGAIVVGRARKTAGSGWLWRGAGKHLWCGFCSRAFPNGVYRLHGSGKTCPYADCDADIARNALEWSQVRERHPNYPAAPWPGIQYPLNPVNADRPGPAGRLAPRVPPRVSPRASPRLPRP